jgi:dTMP kinase
MTTGKFIVIDGTDGSGKTTQNRLLHERLKAEGLDVVVFNFPQYGKKSAGLVENYLNGDYGTAEEVGPYRASIFFACDRYDASFAIKEALSAGKIVLTDRYVTANMGHQGGKLTDRHDRKEYFTWLENLEFVQFGIPKPDLNIILHVAPEIGQRLVGVRGNKQDIHEADINHLKNAEQAYLEIAKIMPNMVLVECVKDDDIMARETIAELIWQEVIKII